MKTSLVSLLTIVMFSSINAQASEIEWLQNANKTAQFNRFDTQENLPHATVYYTDTANWDTAVSRFKIPALTNERATATLCITTWEVERVEQGGLFKKKKIGHYKQTLFNASRLRTMRLATAEELARFTLTPDDNVALYWLGLADGSGLFALDPSTWRYNFCGTNVNGTPWVDVKTAPAHENYIPALSKNGSPTHCGVRDAAQPRLPKSSGPFTFLPAAQADTVVEQCRVVVAEHQQALAANEAKCMADAEADWKRMQEKGAPVRTGFAATLTVGRHCKANSEQTR